MGTVWTADTSGVTADSGNYEADGSSFILFPNVPFFPGVPPLNRISSRAQLFVDTATGAAATILSFLGPISPGLSPGPLPSYAFLGSDLAPDSVLELDVRADSGIMSHPIEEGAFAAYNRVQEPIPIRLMLACTGQGAMTRANFLTTLESLREGTQLVTIATPDAAYPNMALKSYGYRKTAERGAITLWAETTWLEGRSTGVTVSAPPTSQPQGAATTGLGALQPQTPTPSQSAAIANPPVVPAQLPAVIISGSPPSGDAF